MTALKEYITDGLKRGTLQRSEAPDACSFFFIDKKDGKLCPVQDYRPLNAIIWKNAAPIPLILELINKLLVTCSNEAQRPGLPVIHLGTTVASR